MSIYLPRVEVIMVLLELMHRLNYRRLLMLQPQVMKFGLKQVHIISRRELQYPSSRLASNMRI